MELLKSAHHSSVPAQRTYMECDGVSECLQFAVHGNQEVIYCNGGLKIVLKNLFRLLSPTGSICNQMHFEHEYPLKQKISLVGLQL